MGAPNIQDLQNALAAGRTMIYTVTKNPKLVALSAFPGTLALGVGTDPAVKGKAWIKQDTGKTTNWDYIEGSGGGISASNVANDSSVPGLTVKDALENAVMQMSSTEKHVDAALGNDTTGNGTLERPYKTIGKAVLELGVTGTVVLAPGAYNENLSWPITMNLVGNLSDNTSVGGTLSIVTAPGDVAIVQMVNVSVNGLVSLDLSGAAFASISLVNGAFNVERLDSNPATLVQIQGGLGGTYRGRMTVTGVVVAPLSVEAGSEIDFQNVNFLQTAEVKGNAVVKTIGCKSAFGAPLFNGTIESGNTPTWYTDAMSNLGSTGDLNVEFFNKASNVDNDSSVTGATVKDALENLAAGGGGSSSTRWFDIAPVNGKVLPITASRAYYPAILFDNSAPFNDGLGNFFKYVAFYGGGGAPFSKIAYSNDGIAWSSESSVVGVVGDAYHAAAILIGTTIHFFYWDTTVSIYGSNAVRHATMDTSINSSVAITDNACSGTFAGAPVGIRRGTYGFDQIFYNPAPTNNPANPFSYLWCVIHNATDGSNEGICFAISSDGLNFSAYNGDTEVIPRGASPAWDQWIGRISIWIDSLGLWHAFYSGGLGTGAGEDTNFGGGFGYATSMNGITWVKWDKNPVIRKTEMFKGWKRLYTPWVIKDSSGYKVYFSCKNNAGTYIVSYATMGGAV